MDTKTEIKKEIVKVAGRLKEVLTIRDAAGNILHRMVSPLMLEFHAKDVLQVIVGASILAIPVGFTEEVWNLGARLPMRNVLALAVLSFGFIAIFVYYNFYRGHLKDHWPQFLNRSIATYILSFLVVALLLTIIQVTPWKADFAVALKRVILASFPASMSAAVADTIK